MGRVQVWNSWVQEGGLDPGEKCADEGVVIPPGEEVEAMGMANAVPELLEEKPQAEKAASSCTPAR